MSDAAVKFRRWKLSIKWTVMAQLVKNLHAIAGDIRDEAGSLGWKDPLEESKATDSSVLAWRSHMDRGAWRATVHSVAKNQT